MNLPAFIHRITKEDVGQVAAVLGIMGTVFAGLNTIANTIASHSLSRKKRKAAEDVDTYLERLRKLAQSEEAQEDSHFSVYRAELRDNLAQALKALESAQHKIAALKEKRLEEPPRWRKWFVLYRPLSLDGLLTQICFFGLIAWMAMVGVRWIRKPSTADDYVGAGFAALVGALYLSDAASRLWLFSVLLKRNGGSLNDGLSWLRRNLLGFRPKTIDGWMDRLFYYASGLCFLLVAVAFALNPDHWQTRELLGGAAILLLFAVVMRVSRANALIRRSGELMVESMLAEDAAPAPEKS